MKAYHLDEQELKAIDKALVEALALREALVEAGFRHKDGRSLSFESLLERAHFILVNLGASDG